jgi:aminopeptidase N
MAGSDADNLTRDEARTRAGLISDVAYSIGLVVTGNAKDEVFESESVITFDARTDATTFVDLTARTVSSLVVNGETLTPGFNGFRISGIPVRSGRNEIKVTAQCLYGHTGVGMHRVVDPIDGEVYLYTHCEPFDAHKIYACFDQPDLKANFSIRVTAPAEWEVVSNYPETAREGQTRIFETTPKLSTYLAAVIAGKYHVVRSSHGDIPMAIYCRTSLAEHLDPDEFFDITRRGLDFYNDYFDFPYPFKKYDQLLVPEFNVGAMEHPGAVTFNEVYVFRSKVTEGARARRAHTILHEMAHMWFGDLVTMRWWDDLWLNESFAEYMAFHSAALATRWTNSWVDFANSRKQWAIQQDQLPSTHPIVADMVDTDAVRLNFDGITYAKGGSVLRQLVAYVGDSPFRDGIRQYFKDFAWSNASLADFLSALSKASGRDLEPWSKEWLETAGIASLRPVITSDNGVIERLEVEQTAPENHPTLRSHRLRVGLFSRGADGSVLRTSSAELDISGERTTVSQLAGVERPDLLLVNDGDLAFAKVRLDDRSIDTVVASLSKIDDPLTRALCYSAAWDMTRDGELAARRFVDLVCAHAAHELEIVLLERLMAQALRVIDVYGDPANRPRARRQVSNAARRAFAASDSGTDVQLAWARGLIAASDSPPELNEIRGWLEVEATSGLKIDTDLRWAIVSRLAAAGAIGEAEIDAEHERDPSDIGVRRALSCRAARPLESAKQEAWEQLTGNFALPLQSAISLAGGFSQPDQTELLEPYVEKYRTAVPLFWKSLDAESAVAYTQTLFPEFIFNEAVLDMADSLLSSDIPPPAKRIITESKDQALRSARARAVDSAASEQPVAG